MIIIINLTSEWLAWQKNKSFLLAFLWQRLCMLNDNGTVGFHSSVLKYVHGDGAVMVTCSWRTGCSNTRR